MVEPKQEPVLKLPNSRQAHMGEYGPSDCLNSSHKGCLLFITICRIRSPDIVIPELGETSDTLKK